MAARSLALSISLSLFSPSSSIALSQVYDALRMRGHLLRALGAGGGGRSFDWVTGVIHFDRADDDETE